MKTLNPGQWILCHALKCQSLDGMECAGKCTYKTEGEKFKAVNAQRRKAFSAVQEKQNGPRLAIEVARIAKLNEDAQSRAKKGGR